MNVSIHWRVDSSTDSRHGVLQPVNRAKLTGRERQETRPGKHIAAVPAEITSTVAANATPAKIFSMNWLMSISSNGFVIRWGT